MAGDAAWFSPTVLNPDALPALLHPLPMDHPERVDYVVDEAPFAIHEEFLAGPKRDFPRNMTNLDIVGSQSKWQIKDPLDPMTLLKPFPEVWLGSVPNKNLKPSRNLLTNRHVNPIDPIYQLPSGPCTLPAGNADFFSNRVTNLTYCGDIVGASPAPLFKRPIRECYIKECDIDQRTRPAKPTRERVRCIYGGSLDSWDCNIGKKTFGFIRYPQSNPIEPIYATEVHETPQMKYKRLKKRVLPPHKPKWNIAERVLDSMYFRAELLPDACRRHGGETVPFTGDVNYEGLRKTLETFGLKFTDVEYKRLLQVVDKEGRGKVRYRDLANSLRHCDGLELDVATELCVGLGVNWGHTKYAAQKPACMGQSCAVILDEVTRGPKKVVWSDNEQMYNPFTGLILPYHKPAKMSSNNSFAYNLNEVMAARAIKDKDKDLYIPGAYLPRKSIPTTHSCAISDACTLPHVFMEGTSPEAASSYQHDLYALGMSPKGAAPIPDKLPLTEYVPFAMEGRGHQPLPGGLDKPHPGAFGSLPQHGSAGLKAVSFQIPGPPPPKYVGEKVALIDSAKGVGQVVRKASLEGRKLSEGFIKLPTLTEIHLVPIPVNNALGQDVLWRRVEPQRPRLPYMSYKDRIHNEHKTADVSLVKSLILP
ncbi:unnamed protein product [Calypogeia fissa]